MSDLIWIEISRKKIKDNLRALRGLVGDDVVLASCVKANAYGHGMEGVTKVVLESETDWLCVNSVAEAEILRKKKIKTPILILGHFFEADIEKVLRLELRFFLHDLELAKKISKAAKKLKKIAYAHIKVDTGMSRHGILSRDALKFISEIKKLHSIKLEGLATHFACSDELKNNTATKKQLEIFKKLKQDLSKKGFDFSFCHSANSAAILTNQDTYFNFTRPGIAVYGLYPSREVEKYCLKKNIILKPVLSLKTKVVQVKEILAGSTISYGGTYKVKKKTKIAILPIGYYDGLDRKLSNRGHILINGQEAKILGRICMNMTMVDVTGIKTKPGDEAVVIGTQGKKEITADMLADWAGTINYEVVTRLREGIARYYIN